MSIFTDGKETYWFKKNRFLSAQRRLIFKQFDLDNISTYTCRIENDQNIVEIDFKVRDQNANRINSIQGRLYYPKRKIEKNNETDVISPHITQSVDPFKSDGLFLNFFDGFASKLFEEDTFKIRCSSTGEFKKEISI